MHFSRKANCIRVVVGIAMAIVLVVGGCGREEPLTPDPGTSGTANTPDGSTPPADLDKLDGDLRGSSAACAAEAAQKGGDLAKNANGGLSFYQTIYDTDFVSAGVGGLRWYPVPPNPPAAIALGGLSGAVSRAHLYWHGPTNSEDPQANADVAVNGQAVSGVNLGFSFDNCWAYLNSHAYVADVTAIVQATGNGDYELTGFGFDEVNTNGASLLVFFDDGDPANNRDVSIFHGNDSTIANPYDSAGWHATLDGINYQGGDAILQLHISDGQYFNDGILLLNGTVKFPGATNWATGLSVPGAANHPDPSAFRLWDIVDLDVTPELAAAGPPLQTLVLESYHYYDCLSLVVAAVDLPAGAGPDNVAIDIKPGSDPNAINCDNAREVVPVAILTTDDFDALTVDHTTVEFAGAVEAHVSRTTGQPVRHEMDVDEDGDLDLVFHFRLADTTIGCESTEARLTGETYDGTPIAGTDAVAIVPPGDGYDLSDGG